MLGIGPSFMNPGMMKKDPNRLGNEGMKRFNPPMVGGGFSGMGNPGAMNNQPPLMGRPMPRPMGADPRMLEEFKKRMGGNTGIAGTMFGNNPHPGQPLPQLQGPGSMSPGMGNPQMMNQNPMIPSPEVIQRLIQMFSRIRR